MGRMGGREGVVYSQPIGVVEAAATPPYNPVSTDVPPVVIIDHSEPTCSRRGR